MTSTNATMTPRQPEHFVLTVRAPETPGRSGIFIDAKTNDAPITLISQGFQNFGKGKIPTFMDSGASDMMFVSRDAFSEYELTTPHVGDSTKAIDGSFKIIEEGNIIQCYQINGKEHKVTYTHALHAPTLNANLISIGTLDKVGLTTTFGKGQGITWQVDGMVVLAGKSVNWMYLQGLYPATKIPSRIWSFLRIPADLKFGRGPCQICHSRDNLAIPELRPECSPEWTRTESQGMQYLLLLLFFFFGFFVFPN